MITLYGFPKTRALRISWLLEELGLSWQYQLVDFTQGEHRGDDYLGLNPAGKVPALKDGDLTLTESGAIALHLAQTHGQGRLLPPPGSTEAGVHLQWLFYIVTELEQPLWTMGKHRFALPKAQRRAEVLETARWEFAKALKEIDDRIPASGFLMGDQLTVADLFLAHTLNWAVNFDQPLYDNADAFRLRLCAREALQRAREREDAAQASA
ncbi:glutathione S-transferase family protein [Ferrimonas balearica]|uniref:glutathione S-transferase family protein n=1 Tax=Ferrimonas balearica TaxID=44012 RepID=UPI001C99277C|nr:glutathione S-transferase family protein [Ferrimonas balearica]MBY5992602.1 glutathione S-transferase family protein [Ferrimonas balearica]